MSDTKDGDELFAGIRAQADLTQLALEPLHPRVLEVQEEDGAALVITCWRNPGGARSFHAALRQRVEAALIAELSRSARELEEAGRDRRLSALRVVLFEDIGTDEELAAATAAFALRPAEPTTPGWREALAHLRGEAQRIGVKIPDMPVKCLEARVEMGAGDRADAAQAFELALRDSYGELTFGAQPGALFARAMKHQGTLGIADAGIAPTVEGIDAFELAVGSMRPGVIRWIAPATFQALCDAVAVVAVKAFGRNVQWAETEDDALGMPSPPLIRAQLDDGMVHIPLGAHIMRWCLMPLMPDERVPPLSEWVVDQFGTR